METTNLTFSPIGIATSSQTIYPCITKPLRFREYEYYIIVRGIVRRSGPVPRLAFHPARIYERINVLWMQHFRGTVLKTVALAS